MREVFLKSINVIVFQWRNCSIFSWRQAVEDGIPSMDNKMPNISSLTHSFDKIPRKIVRLNVIDAQSALNSTWNVHSLSHFSQTICHQLRLFHQTGTKTATLYSRTRTTNIEIDLVISELSSHHTSLS